MSCTIVNNRGQRLRDLSDHRSASGPLSCQFSELHFFGHLFDCLEPQFTGCRIITGHFFRSNRLNGLCLGLIRDYGRRLTGRRDLVTHRIRYREKRLALTGHSPFRRQVRLALHGRRRRLNRLYNRLRLRNRLLLNRSCNRLRLDLRLRRHLGCRLLCRFACCSRSGFGLRFPRLPPGTIRVTEQL